MERLDATITENCVMSLERRYKNLGGQVYYENGRIYLKNNGLPLKEYVIMKARENNLYYVQITNAS